MNSTQAFSQETKIQQMSIKNRIDPWNKFLDDDLVVSDTKKTKTFKTKISLRSLERFANLSYNNSSMDAYILKELKAIIINRKKTQKKIFVIKQNTTQLFLIDLKFKKKKKKKNQSSLNKEPISTNEHSIIPEPNIPLNKEPISTNEHSIIAEPNILLNKEPISTNEHSIIPELNILLNKEPISTNEHSIIAEPNILENNSRIVEPGRNIFFRIFSCFIL
ncbi:hypothetical protein CDIK_0115 [Cucumispora dikerogammari]|nr:hypothetical protein CDIK_0115 [Cucumispora dikerogammari]